MPQDAAAAATLSLELRMWRSTLCSFMTMSSSEAPPPGRLTVGASPSCWGRSRQRLITTHPRAPSAEILARLHMPRASVGKEAETCPVTGAVMMTRKTCSLPSGLYPSPSRTC